MDKNVGVVFDLDDTLYLERDYARSGFHAVGEWCIERLGLKGVQECAQTLFDEGRRGNIFDVVLEQLGARPDPRTVDMMVRRYREHAPNIKLLPDAVECLARLKGTVYLSLLTDGNPVSQRAKIDALGLCDCFNTTVITGEWGIEYFKPHVRGYRYIESKSVGCQGRFVYIADNPSKDFFAPRILGWNAIRVRRQGGLHEDRECPPQLARFEVSNLETVPNLIFELYRIEL